MFKPSSCGSSLYGLSSAGTAITGSSSYDICRSLLSDLGAGFVGLPIAGANLRKLVLPVPERPLLVDLTAGRFRSVIAPLVRRFLRVSDNVSFLAVFSLELLLLLLCERYRPLRLAGDCVAFLLDELDRLTCLAMF